MSTSSATFPTKSPDLNPIEASIYISGLHMPSQSHIFQPKFTKSSKRKKPITKSGKLPSPNSYRRFRASDHLISIESVITNAELEAKPEHDTDLTGSTTLENLDERITAEHRCESSDCGECNNNNGDDDNDSDCNKITTSGNSSSSSGSKQTLPLRDRAISAPANGVTLSPMDQKLAVNPVIAESKHETEHEPTAQDWTAGIDCISKLLGAMLADDDRGAARP